MIVAIIIILILVIGILSYFLLDTKKKLKNKKDEVKKLKIKNEDIVITKALDKGNIKAFVTLKVNDTILLKDMRIIANKDEDNQEKLKIEVPVRITNKGHLLDIYKFIDYNFRQKLFDKILDKYKRL